MPTYNFQSAESELTITSPVVMGFDNEHVQHITRLMQNFHLGTPVIEFHFWEVGPDHYTYKVELVDGREWIQELFFAGPMDEDPQLTFSPTGLWKASESLRHVDIRLNLIHCKKAHGTTDWKWEPI